MCVLSKSVFLLVSIRNVSWDATISVLHLNRYTAVNTHRTQAKRSVGLLCSTAFRFHPVNSFNLWDLLPLKGGVGCMALYFNFN